VFLAEGAGLFHEGRGATISATNYIGHSQTISATAKNHIGHTENQYRTQPYRPKPYRPQNIGESCLKWNILAKSWIYCINMNLFTQS